MGVSMRLEVRQSQSLALTPQLLQSIRLLQFDRHDLADFLRREGDRNPLLKVEDRAGMRRPPRGAPNARTAGSDVFETAAEPAPSLHAHALSEIDEVLRLPAERRVARALVAELDEAGYLRIDPAETAARLGVALPVVESVLARLRDGAEPAGLFARDLAQCLALQLERQGRMDDGIAAVLAQLELVARRDVRALARVSGRDAEGVADLVALLRGLDPKPGSAFGSAGPVAIEPDIFVEERGAGGGWRVVLNARSMPRVSLDSDLARDIMAGCRDETARAFVEDCRAQANAILRAVDRRASSILKVATHVLRRQTDFLDEGPRSLRPMTLAAVAEAVGLHESTISRIVSGKFVQTPRGTFELKFFFSGALASSSGDESYSASGVRERIRLIVAAERPGAVLSDEDIAARLRGEGVELARRTVAKYREALGIASSARRRREMGLRRLAS